MTNDDIAYLRLLADWHDRKTLWAEKIQSTTDAGSLNTFGRNEIEVAPNVRLGPWVERKMRPAVLVGASYAAPLP
jgi:hypothetical protein